MAHELKINYGTKIDEVLRVDLVTRDEIIFNTYYEGDAKAGAVKIPVRDGETEVAAFDKTIYKDAHECLTFTFKFSKLNWHFKRILQ